MKTILINATAAHSSGGLSVLKNFMSFLYSSQNLGNEFIFHLITSTQNLFFPTRYIIIHESPILNWKQRIAWDKKNIQKWCETNNVFPDVVISFQNTCSNFKNKYKNVKQVVYYHQLLPLVSYRWKWYRKSEFTLFLYSKFYGHFVNRWNKNAEYVVQLSYVKRLFCSKFKNIEPERVHVIIPNLCKIVIEDIETKAIDYNKKVFLFPAIPARYKNHMVIIEALELLKKENPVLFSKVLVIFTVPEDSHIAIDIKSKKLENTFACIGNISFDELLTYYKRCDALLFPSEIESFGLPLIEAASFGKPIIAADLPYAREVLKNYKGCFFLKPRNANDWKNYIKKIIESNSEFIPLKTNPNNTWNDFISIISSL